MSEIEYKEPAFTLNDPTFKKERILSKQNELSIEQTKIIDLRNAIKLTEVEDKQTGETTEYVSGLEEAYINQYIDKYIKITANPLLGRPYALDAENIWHELFDPVSYIYQNVYSQLEYVLQEFYDMRVIPNKLIKQLKTISKEYPLFLPKIPDANSPLIEVQEPNKVAFMNGIYNFNDDSIQPIQPEDYITSRIPYDLQECDENDPQVQYIKSYLEWLTGDSTPLLMAYMGFLFYRSQETIQTMMIFVNGKTANGRNGKGKLIELMQTMLGNVDNYSAISMSVLADSQDKFIRKNLKHKYANFDAEAGTHFLNDTALLKQISSNDMLTADVKNKDPMQFRSYARLILATNHLPEFRDDSDGIKERWVLVPFIRKVTSDANKQMWNKPDSLYSSERKNKDMYSVEALGKWAWACIQSFKRLVADNNNANPFKEIMTLEAKDILAGMEYDNDPISQFLAEYNYTVTGNEDDYIIQQTLWDQYQEFTDGTGKNKTNFFQELGAKGATTRVKIGNTEKLRAPRKKVEGTSLNVILGIKPNLDE